MSHLHEIVKLYNVIFSHDKATTYMYSISFEAVVFSSGFIEKNINGIIELSH